MQEEPRSQLTELNRNFYNIYAKSFSSTRQRVQAGIKLLLRYIPQNATILDLGCGNGNFSRELANNSFSGSYLGLDNSPELILEAQTQIITFHTKGVFEFALVDLTDSNWINQIQTGEFDVITAFAFLHHLPGCELRSSVFNSVRHLLKPTGSFFLSVWQVQNSRRLQSHIVPWSVIQIDQSKIEDGDLLMDWRSDKKTVADALRYVHCFSSSELKELGTENNLFLISEFESDGKEGNLGLYQVWSKTPKGV